MDFLALINHVQKRISANRRVHGIGQGHDPAFNRTAEQPAGIAVPPSADRPLEAEIDFMNADRLDGHHAREIYQGNVPGPLGGINSDTLDGVDKSLGHVSGSSDFNNPDTLKASAVVTLSGVPKQNDRLVVSVYDPAGLEFSVTVDVQAGTPVLDDIAPLVITALNADATFASKLRAEAVQDKPAKIKVSSKTPGAYGNLYGFRIAVTPAQDSTLAVDRLGGVYRLEGGEAATSEGINADKVDGLHAREHYHKSDAGDAAVKAPPSGRGVNADTVDSYHAREAYHGIQPEANTGFNADTLDGVHKLFGHKKNGNADPCTARISVGADPALGLAINGGIGTVLTLTLYNVKGDVVETKDFTSAAGDARDDIVDQIVQYLPQVASESEMSKALFVSDFSFIDNFVEFTTRKGGERFNYVLALKVTDAAEVEPFRIKKAEDPVAAYTAQLELSLQNPANALLGVDADMFDGVHADQGHVVPNVTESEGVAVPAGVNADQVDSLHARTAGDGATVSVLDQNGKTDSSAPYLPVADGIQLDAQLKPTHAPQNPNLDADTLDGAHLRGNAPDGEDYVPMADQAGPNVKNVAVGATGYTVSQPKNPKLDAETVQGWKAEELLTEIAGAKATASGAASAVSGMSDALATHKDSSDHDERYPLWADVDGATAASSKVKYALSAGSADYATKAGVAGDGPISTVGMGLAVWRKVFSAARQGPHGTGFSGVPMKDIVSVQVLYKPAGDYHWTAVQRDDQMADGALVPGSWQRDYTDDNVTWFFNHSTSENGTGELKIWAKNVGDSDVYVYMVCVLYLTAV